tara:strand:- start:67 stop:240 length:174 start_codon:yes stop_codon:yes gene_type:complete
MSKDKGYGRIIAWAIEVEWSNGVVEKLDKVDERTAREVDDYLTEIVEPSRNENKIYE